MKTKTVLVTGAAGFIGPKVVELLLTTGYRVIVLDKLTYAARVEKGKPLSLEIVLESLSDEVRKRYSFVRWDISDPSLPLKDLLEVGGVDHVIHMAAESHVDRATEGKPDFIQTEIHGTFNVLSAIREQNTNTEHRIRTAVFVSTDEVYGSIDRIAEHEGERWYGLSDAQTSDLINKYKFTEATTLAGGSPYAACKGGADLLVGAYFNTFKSDIMTGSTDNERMPVIITRGVNNFGPFQHPEKLIPMVICTLLMPDVSGNKRCIPVYDKGLSVREWLTTEDYASAIMYVMEHGNVGEVYNVGSGNRCRNRDLLLAIFRACQPHIPTAAGFSKLADATFDATTVGGVARPGHDLCYAVNCEKLRQFGWQPKHASNFEEEIKEVIKWYIANPDWWKPLWVSQEFTDYWERKYRKIQNAAGCSFNFYTSEQEEQELSQALL